MRDIEGKMTGKGCQSCLGYKVIDIDSIIAIARFRVQEPISNKVEVKNEITKDL